VGTFSSVLNSLGGSLKIEKKYSPLSFQKRGWAIFFTMFISLKAKRKTFANFVMPR